VLLYVRATRGPEGTVLTQQPLNFVCDWSYIFSVKDNINGTAVLFPFFPSSSEAHLKGECIRGKKDTKGINK
jgi:hypothetical protein